MRGVILSIAILFMVYLVGCGSETTKPVAVDREAAYPKQDPGTKPPVLRGTEPLSTEELQAGWLRLFDGVSTYGWESNGGKIDVRQRNEKPMLVFQNDSDQSATLEYMLPVGQFDWIGDHKTIQKTQSSKMNFSASREDAATMHGILTFSIPSNALFELYSAKIKPLHAEPLGKNAWKSPTEPVRTRWADDGTLELSGGSGMVESVESFDDFLLQLEYRTDERINSGVFFRCIPGEKMNGYECQILNDPPEEDYKQFIGTDTGGIFRRQVGRNVGPKDGEWNYLAIAAKGNRFATWVNGIRVTDWTDTRPEDPNPRKGRSLQAGTLQLQGHDSKTKILFRNIRIVRPQ